MFERLTIDVVADAITDQVMTGVPRAKLAHKFFRKGRRDGRRQLDPTSISTIDRMAVRTAMSRLHEAYLRQKAELERRRATLQQQIAEGDSVLGESLPATAAPGVSNVGSTDSVAESLGQAVKVLEAKRSASRAAAASEALRERQSKANEEAAAARIELEGVQSDLDNLVTLYDQQRRTCLEIGGFLWARYVSGYEYGQTRRWRKATRRDVDPEIHFDIEGFPG